MLSSSCVSWTTDISADRMANQATDETNLRRIVLMIERRVAPSMNLAWGTKIKQKQQPALKLNDERIDDAVLALLYLNPYYCGFVWKGFDWDAMNRLVLCCDRRH
jgi:hypothetical protein